MKKHENLFTSYQRLRRPLRDEFELELKERILDILIRNFNEEKRTTRFDFNTIKKISQEIMSESKDHEGLNLEKLFPA